MKALIAISSCGDFERNGNNDALRHTWLADLAKFPELSYKFFFGVGQEAPQLEDSILLHDVPDDYGHLSYKTQASLRWAHALGYDFVFRCFPDTYVQVERLMACPFPEFDYYGDFRCEEGGRTNGGTGEYRPTLQQAQNYASGGPGYWLSRRAFTLLLGAPVTGIWRDEITPYAEDLWVGNILGRGPQLRYFDDQRFINKGSSYWPSPDNETVTAHMSCPTPYDKSLMYAAHAVWLAHLSSQVRGALS